MSDPHAEQVSMLHAFERDSALAGTPHLAYPNLINDAATAQRITPEFFREFLGAEPGSLEEEYFARQAAIGYYVLTGLQLQQTKPEYQIEIADRFTTASIELYDQPDENEFQRLLQLKVGEFSELKENPAVDQERVGRLLKTLEAYSAPRAEISEASEDFAIPARRLAEALVRRFADALAVFDVIDQDVELEQQDIIELFERARQIIAATDLAWDTLAIKAQPKQSMSTMPEENAIYVGTRPHKQFRAKQLFCHEALVHALRAINSRKTGNQMLERGLPNYLDAEEGIAVFIEYGLSGEIPAVRTDRYVDFGLALGLFGPAKLTRDELHQHYVDRTIVRRQRDGKDVNFASIEREGWGYVNRIYRGSLENDVVSVNTKDLAYYNGFLKIGRYVTSALNNGVDEADLIDELLAARYDPTSELHRKYWASHIND